VSTSAPSTRADPSCSPSPRQAPSSSPSSPRRPPPPEVLPEASRPPLARPRAPVLPALDLELGAQEEQARRRRAEVGLRPTRRTRLKAVPGTTALHPSPRPGCSPSPALLWARSCSRISSPHNSASISFELLHAHAPASEFTPPSRTQHSLCYVIRFDILFFLGFLVTYHGHPNATYTLCSTYITYALYTLPTMYLHYTRECTPHNIWFSMCKSNGSSSRKQA
jgi:hypothetical protein